MSSYTVNVNMSDFQKAVLFQEAFNISIYDTFYSV